MDAIGQLIVGTFFGACLAVIVYSAWGSACSERAYRCRVRILDALNRHEGADFWRLHEHFDRVSYDEHFLTLVVLDDWRKLYHPDLIALIEPRPASAKRSAA